MNSENIKSKPVFVKFTLAFSDLFFFNFSLFLSVAIISFISNDIYEYIPKSVMGTFFFSHFVLSLACTFWFLVRLRHYSYRKPFWFELKEMLRTIIIFAIISLAFVGFSKWELSRYVWLLTWLFALILIPAFRIITKHVFNVLGLWKKQTIIIGSGRNAEEAYVALQSEEILGFDIVAFYCLSPEDERESLFGKKLIKSEEELWGLVDPENTQVIVAVEFEQHALRDYWLKSLAKHACRSVSVIPTLRGVPLYGTDMSFIFSHEVMILRVNNNLAKLTSRFVKRVFDIFGSLAIMIMLSPVLLGILLMVSKDGGKPIYGHERVGLKGRKFKCLKFRSMVTNSKEVLANLLATDSEALDEWNKDFKLKNDPRITKIGGFIRKTSLDELPQLWNVLRGDMSLVGPRPIIEEELERYAGDVDYYLMAKPGMTGLWQVSGRNDVDYDTRVYFDSWYVKNWSLWNDIVILFKTVNVVLKKDGAY